MDDHQLRSILLNLQYRLKDGDRERLHFYLKNDVPRPVSDDSTLSGTLRLMQSLFDQDKINENDFTLLIDAFKQIRCSDAVSLLREHQRRMQLSGCNQSTQSLASIMPSVVEEVLNDYEDDKGPSGSFLLRHINYNNNDIDSNDININPININDDTRSLLSSRKRQFWASSLKNQCVLLTFISFTLTLAALIVVLIEGRNSIRNLKDDLQIKQKSPTRIQDQDNQTIKQSTDRFLETNATIIYLKETMAEFNRDNFQMAKDLSEKQKDLEQLKKTLAESNQQQNQSTEQLKRLLREKEAEIERWNTTLIESKKERKTLLIRAGRKFGGDGGGYFDDSLPSIFTCAHYLSGIIYYDLNDLSACQFIYTSSHDNQSRIESRIYGNNGVKFNSTYQYYLDDDERIVEVFVKSADRSFVSMNKIVFTTKIVIRLQFVTTKGRIIPPRDVYEMDATAESEHFYGYILGYVTGKDGLRIDQLQFFWYRSEKIRGDD